LRLRCRSGALARCRFSKEPEWQQRPGEGPWFLRVAASTTATAAPATTARRGETKEGVQETRVAEGVQQGVAIALGSRGIRKAHWVVTDVGITVLGLWVLRARGRAANGVGGGPAALDAVFADKEVIEAARGVLALGGVLELAGIGRFQSAAGSVGLAKRSIGGIEIFGAGRSGGEADAAEIISVAVILEAGRVIGSKDFPASGTNPLCKVWPL
jgi:hypothetical protein